VGAGREFGAALGAVLDGGRELLAAAHAEPRAGRVGRLAGRARRTGLRRSRLLLLGRGTLAVGCAVRLVTVLRRAAAARTVRRHTLLSRGLLSGRLLGRRLLRPERARQPEPGPEERPVDAGAALGHALARAESHLALGVVLEAAGQLGVARVLG